MVASDVKQDQLPHPASVVQSASCSFEASVRFVFQILDRASCSDSRQRATSSDASQSVFARKTPPVVSKSRHTFCLIRHRKGRCSSAVLRSCISYRWVDCRCARRDRRCGDRLANRVDSLHRRHHPVGDPSRHRTKRSRRLIGDLGRPSGRPRASPIHARVKAQACASPLSVLGAGSPAAVPQAPPSRRPKSSSDRKSRPSS